MPTPAKPYLVLEQEGKSHRTQAELNQRKESEESLTTGVHMCEWDEVNRNPDAHKEFTRVRDLLERIGKDDGLYESIVNRYAMIRAECLDFEKRKKSVTGDFRKLATAYKKQEIDFLTYSSMKDKLNSTIIAFDRQIQAKRKMLLDIEKENIMTIASSLRSIPKKVTKEEPKGGMAERLSKRYGSK